VCVGVLVCVHVCNYNIFHVRTRAFGGRGLCARTGFALAGFLSYPVTKVGFSRRWVVGELNRVMPIYLSFHVVQY